MRGLRVQVPPESLRQTMTTTPKPRVQELEGGGGSCCLVVSPPDSWAAGGQFSRMFLFHLFL